MNLQYTKRGAEKHSAVPDPIEEKIVRRLLPDIEKLAACDLNYPPVNVTESADSFTIELCAPGFKKSDFIVLVEDQELLIIAERESAETGGDESEFTPVFLKRSFALPAQIEVSKISATYDGGILKVTLPQLDYNREHLISEIAVM